MQSIFVLRTSTVQFSEGLTDYLFQERLHFFIALPHCLFQEQVTTLSPWSHWLLIPGTSNYPTGKGSSVQVFWPSLHHHSVLPCPVLPYPALGSRKRPHNLHLDLRTSNTFIWCQHLWFPRSLGWFPKPLSLMCYDSFGGINNLGTSLSDKTEATSDISWRIRGGGFLYISQRYRLFLRLRNIAAFIHSFPRTLWLFSW